MKRKKIVIIGITFLIILSLSIYYILNKEDKNTTLNLLEKQWIEKHKNTVIDIGVINDIPIFNYEGTGVFFDFLDNLEETIGLELNKVPFKYGDNSEVKYAFNVVDKISEDDILIYRDNYVIVTNEKHKYIDLNEIKGLVIGVLSSDLEQASIYLKNTSNNIFKPYDDVDTMFLEITKVQNSGETENETEETKEVNSIDAMLIPKTLYMDRILKREDLYIAYNVTEMSKSYVLTLGTEERLNNILSKFYDKWEKENFVDSFNKHFSDNYFTFKNINKKDVANFRSKRYIYGFVENPPYDIKIHDKLQGYNSAFLKEFAKLAEVEIVYEEFSNNNLMYESFNSNKIDLMLETNTNYKYKMDVYKTIPFYNNMLVVVSNMSNNLVVNSLNSLFDQELMVINNSEIANYLSQKQLKVKSYNNISELVKNIKKESIIVIDKEMYNYYASNKLNDHKVYYEEALPNDYGLVIRDIEENKIFATFLDFYLSFANNKDILNDSYYRLFNIDKKPIILKYLIVSLAVIIIGVSTYFITKTLRNEKDVKLKKIVSKEDKMKYIDQLTSLKNRAYLNDNIEVWDESEIYPQAVIVVDLNKIAYINDNYGHNEGDKVIKEAANILIQNQMENSDIIRTSGNEFLIYLVGYDEKAIVSYVRKLKKELKNISHNFGAAIGYSMIVDAIKTIDDAINEATLEMRDDKEAQEQEERK